MFLCIIGFEFWYNIGNFGKFGNWKEYLERNGTDIFKVFCELPLSEAHIFHKYWNADEWSDCI